MNDGSFRNVFHSANVYRKEKMPQLKELLLETKTNLKRGESDHNEFSVIIGAELSKIVDRLDRTRVR